MISGQWLCRPCGDGARPTCVLCPNQGGAMKCTPSGHKWAHVSCVLWIPEVSIGCAEKMEPITKISSIPASRWSLLCVLCRERKGACIQCSVKSCKTAYHVTCAFKHGLEMRAIIEDENADDGVKLRSYCQKHSVNSKKEKSGSGSEEEEVKRKRRKDMTSEEKTQARAARLQEIEKEFDKHVSVKDISSHLLDVDQDAINYIYNYWKLKRRSGHNRPLLPPKSDDNELLSHRQEQADLDKMKQFVQLRQDLERVRNLCYMVSRREKLSRSFFRLREQTFHKQVAVLSDGAEIPEEERAAICEANHGPSIYDTLYSHPDVPERTIDFADLLAKIAPPDSNDEKKKDRNGLRRSKSSNPYRKHYVNGSRRSGSMYSGLSSEESDAEIARSSKYRPRAVVDSTTDDDEARQKPSTSSPKKKVSPKTKTAKKSPKKIDNKKKKKMPQSKAVVESSSEDDTVIALSKRDKAGSKTLRQMEKEMAARTPGQSGSDSDELLPIRSTRSTKFPVDIYSDSSEDSANDKPEVKKDKDKIKDEKFKSKKSPSASDPQQSLPRTKAAMKEFIPSHAEKKESVSSEERPAPKKRGRKPSIKEKKPPTKTQESDDEAKNKENKFSKPKDNPTDLIVPQRQAAKKASENMRSTSTGKKEENAIEKSPEEVKIKAKGKGKGKEIKSPPTKLTRQTSKDAEKETIAYVPQRQAAKKAAAHIKNIGSKVPAPETSDASKKKEEKQDSPKSSDESPIKKKENAESSSSSSGSSSSSYSSSSSSEYEELEKAGPKPATKAREIKPAVAAKPPSLFSPPSARPTVDLPFLDKVSKPLSSTSASSDSDSHSDGSGSSSPTPKRPRRRRKHASDDASPRKGPDTKLKTSERESERGVSPPAAEREEPAGASGANARAASRARTRSTAASGSLPELLDTGSRKPSKDDVTHTASPATTPKESDQSSELPPPEWKAHETLKDSPKESRKRPSPKSRRRSSVAVDRSPERPSTPNDLKPKSNKVERPTVSDAKDKPPEKQPSPMPDKPSPRKSVEQRRKSISSRRMSVKEPTQKDAKDQVVPTAEEVIEPIKQRRQSRYETRDTKTARESVSPGKKSASDKPQAEVPDKKTPIRMNDVYNDSEKWLPKAPSPTHVLTPIERPGGNEKYMTDDKSFDSADVCTEKSSVKMFAKIQANLNENTMIKSPRTPMDARSLAPEEENPVKNLRKRPALEPVTQQDASHVQGVEISKSAKIPSTVYHDRPPTSPQQKDNELFAFDMLAVDDGFNHDEIMKPFSSFPDFYFKEDSKEQGRQETLNLVDRLRMQLSAKKAPENSQQEPSADDKDHIGDEHRVDDYRGDDYRGDEYGEDHRMQDVNAPVEHNKHDEELSPGREIRQEMETHVVASPQQHHNTMNHIQHSIAPAEMPRRKSILEDKEYHPMAMTSNDKWHAGAALGDSQMEHESRKYDHNAYADDRKEEEADAASAREPQSISEVGDTISKQSDDSQPSAVDNSNGTIDVETIRENTHSYDNADQLRAECRGGVTSPYAGHESQWRESEIPRRRSSASSTDSEASGARELHAPAGGMPGIDSYPPIPAYSCPVEPSMPLNQYATYPPDASPFLTTMSSLFGGGACSQLPLPSPGPLYAPPLSYSAAGLLPPKPPFRRLCAAFTSSSQNIALTTAMIAPPTPKPLDSPARDDTIDITPEDKFSTRASSPSICVDDSTYETSQSRITKMSNDSNETVTSMNQQECKSPPKPIPPVKLPIKFPGKSPGKSPGISPKRSETSKSSKRSSNRSNRGNRGRGRSKSRGQGAHPYPPVDYLGDSIRNKLVGTVYDFEEEIANDGVDLKALRDRRKSVDVRDDRRSEHSYKDTSQSPRVHSPQRASKKTPTGETKEYRPLSEEPEDRPESVCEDVRGFVHVPPLLPGPVDMRTYQPEAAPLEYLRPALAYSAAAAERHLADLEEEHAPPPAHRQPPAHHYLPPLEAYVPLPKVSLSDSRNQLKVKIKGPFLDANYCASSVAAVPAPAPAPPLEPPPFNTVVAASSAMAGSTSLRRMRKKELLRQYWTQDMNMDDPTSAALMGAAPPPAAPPPPRAVITIPKAVASMTSIPTREDYKILDPPIVETKTKKRKVSSGLSRELRHLKVTMNDEAEPGDEVKLSSLAPTAGVHKRRARLSVKPAKLPHNSPLAPKLKIKIGAGTVSHISEELFDFRPPKKRLIHKPSLEDLRRESMKYRKMVMADFEENEKTTSSKHKSSKSEKRKKKKDKKADKLQVVNSESESAPKLIIKIKRPTAEGGQAAAAAAAAPVADPFDYDPTAPDPLALDTPCYSEGLSAMRKVRTAKVTPIRLKLARTQGSSYVMAEEAAAPAEPAAAPAAAPDDPAAVR